MATVTVNPDYASVSNAVANLVNNGDTLKLTSGSPTWTQPLSITKNISIIGAGVGQTVITESLSPHVPVFDVNLTTERRSSPTDYSFRLSSMSLRSTVNANYGQDKGFVNINAKVLPANSQYQLGCASHVRVDHIDWQDIGGFCLFCNSVLGVVDHCTIRTTGSFNPVSNYPMLFYNINWTPNGRSSLSATARGSWEDDAYWGEERFMFIEDCYFQGLYFNICDQLEGARTVFRHCTCDSTGAADNGISMASHGMEGRLGVRAQEVYNNKFICNGGPAQTRSGNILLYNNVFTNIGSGNQWPLQNYRTYTVYTLWGYCSGNNVYDGNDTTNWGPGVVGGVYQGVTTGASTLANHRGNFVDGHASADALGNFIQAGITAKDGYIYCVVNTNARNVFPPGPAKDGWRWLAGGCIESWNTTTHTINVTSSNLTNPLPTAVWELGDSYEVRRCSNIFGQIGSGRFALSAFGNTNTTADPQGTAGSAHKEPSYSWNNWDNAQGVSVGINSTGAAYSVRLDHDYFNKGDLPHSTTAKVGYDPSNPDSGGELNPHATDTPPLIILDPDNQTPATYTPYPYPHPIAGGVAPGPSISSNGGTTFTVDVPNGFSCVSNPKRNCFLVTTANFVGTVTIGRTGTMPTDVTFVDNGDGTATFSGNAHGATGGPNGTIYSQSLTASASGGQSASQTFDLKIQSPNQAPACSLTSPADGTTFTAPATITLQSTASDSDGQIATIEYLYGGTPPGGAGATSIKVIDATITPSPYTYFWNQSTAGNYALTVKAVDNVGGAGGTTISSPAVSITVTTGPPSGLVAPTISVSG